MIISQISIIIVIGVFLLILAACESPTPTPTPPAAPSDTPSQTPTRRPIPTQVPSLMPTLTPTPSRTPGPSPTATMQPTLAVHIWQPDYVLIQAGTRDQDNRSPFNQTPRLVLYADGRLFLRQCTGGQCNYGFETLSRVGTCSLLNAIDQLGFFDYDSSTYHSPASGGQAVYIQVNAWRNNFVLLDQLESWISDPTWFDKLQGCQNCAGRPDLPPALVNTFHLLWDYTAQDLTPYEPDRLALWLSTDRVAATPAPWPLSAPNLDQLVAQARCPDGSLSQGITLEGDDAYQITGIISQAIAAGYPPVFTDGTLQVQISSQWLLPGEAPASCAQPANRIPGPGVPTPDFTLQCNPVDGVLMTPTPYHR